MFFEVRAVATVRSTRKELDDDHWDRESTSLELLEDVPAEALAGLDQFSHVEVVFLADRASDVPPAPWSRRPRGNPQWPQVGIFAQRNKDRPNRILVSVARIVKVKERSVEVHGLDAVDGTPVLDIKPVFAWSAARGDFHSPAWAVALGEQYFS